MKKMRSKFIEIDVDLRDYADEIIEYLEDEGYTILEPSEADKYENAMQTEIKTLQQEECVERFKELYNKDIDKLHKLLINV